MQETNILIRDANENDLDSLWDMVHAEALPISPETLSGQLRVIRVMTCGDRLIGARSPTWQAFHPLLPDRRLSALWDRLERDLTDAGLARSGAPSRAMMAVL